MTSSYKKPYPSSKSFSSNGTSHYGSHKKIHPKAHSESYSSLLEELSHPKLGEREFNDRVKFWLENYSDVIIIEFRQVLTSLEIGVYVIEISGDYRKEAFFSISPIQSTNELSN